MLKWIGIFLFLFCSTATAADSLWVVVDTVNNPGLAMQFFIEPPVWKTEKLPTGEYIEIEGKQYPIMGKEVQILTGRCIQTDSLGVRHIINARIQGHPERMQIVLIVDELPYVKSVNGRYEDEKYRLWLDLKTNKIIRK